jgi:hypothetical protein
MCSFYQFSSFAASRGEGLHPKLQALLEMAATSPVSELSMRHEGLVQAGPDPDSEIARFIEHCAVWATGGWRNADPPYARLLAQAITLVFGRYASEREEQDLSAMLMAFLNASISSNERPGNSTRSSKSKTTLLASLRIGLVS